MKRAHLATLAISLVVAACSSDDEGPPPSTNHIEVTSEPARSQMIPGESVSLYAEVQDSAGQPIGCLYPLKWTNSNPQAVDLQTLYPTYVYAYARRPGKAVLTVKCEGLSTSVPLEVVTLSADSVDITPDTAAAVVGNKVQMTVTLYDSAGRLIEGRDVAWQSSSSGIARVNSTGEVTAVSAGVATITATSGTGSATARFTSVASVAGDWSAVTDWVTFQGDSMHTGFVPATVDARAIHRRWEATPSVAWLHAAVAVGDWVFVSTRTYFGNQFLYALNAATGATTWSHDFGPVESVNQPAFGDGAVYIQNGGQDDSYIWAFEVATGAERFHSPFVNQWTHFFAPVVSGSTVYAGGGYGAGVYAWDALSGAQLWFTELPQTGDYTPAVRNGQVYAHPGYPNWGPVALTAMAAGGGSIQYDIPATGPSAGAQYAASAAPALSGNRAYITNESRIIAYDLGSHTVAWQKLDNFHGQVTIGSTALYVYNGEKVEARRISDGGLLWSWAPPSGLDGWAQVVATNNLIFVSANGTTYALDIAAHAPVWSTSGNGFLSIAKDGTLYIAQSNGKLAAFALR